MAMSDMGPNGLFVSNQGNVKEIKNIATEHTQIEFTDYKDACYSPDGLKIAFIYEKCLEDDIRIMGLATSNVNGKELSVSFEGKEIYNPFYDTAGNFIFCFQTKNDRQVLVRYDISKHQTTDLVVFPENYISNGTVQWTKGGYLALPVIIGKQDIYNSQFTTRYIILDLTNNIVIYASPISSAFTRFDSLLN